jgi:hypothetical protein
MAQATFSYEGICTRLIVSREEDISWMEEFLVPWFDTTGRVPDVEVRLIYDPMLFQRLHASGCTDSSAETFMMDNSTIDFPVWNGISDQLTLYDEKHRLFYLVSDRHIELILGDRKANARLCVMRVVRELAMGAAQLAGGRFLHAAAFAVDGNAAIIAGPRQSGKTSLLSYALANSQARFLSNDRLLMKMQAQAIGLRGMPTIVSLREGTVDLFPGMRQSIVERGYISKATLRECKESGELNSFPAKPGRHGLSPHQFCKLLDCKPAKEASGAVLLFPRRTGGAGNLQLRRLEPEETRDRLKDCFFGFISPDRHSEVFTRIPKALERQSAPDDPSFCAALADSVAAYDCELGNQAFIGDTGAKQLLQLLQEREIRSSAADATVASASK